MYLKRQIYSKLLEWKEYNSQSTLEVNGARQVGKTYLINKFADENFKHKIYINLFELSGKQFLECYNQAMQWKPGTKRPEHPLHDAFRLYDIDFVDTEDTVIIIDEIQESAEIYNRIREFTRQFQCRFIVTGSYLGRVYDSEFRYSSGDVTKLTIYTLSFEEFLQAYSDDLYENYRRLAKKEPVEDIYAELKTVYDLYCQIGGYPKVVETYLLTKSIQQAQGELVKIMDTFVNESIRYFTDVLDSRVYNKLKQKWEQLKYEMEENKILLGFGSKALFRKQYFLEENGYSSHTAWYRDYIRQRDKNVYYLGSNNETQGNQMFQMKYHAGTDDFSIQVRKDFGYEKEEKYVIDQIDFKYQKKLLQQICMAYENRERPHALSYRIHRNGKKWYLQVLFTIEYRDYETVNTNGVFGLDYNDGFIEVSETDEKGNLIGQCHYDLQYHGTGKKAKTEIEQTINQIVNLAKEKGKSIAIENLNFKQTKAKRTEAKTKRGKSYNRMLHKFDYSRYKNVLANCSHRKKVELILVNPKYTSKIGKQKYSDRMKLSVHQAASYVIARKGQGYIDTLAG